MKISQRLCLATLLITVWTNLTLADVRIPAIFGSHMVLQQGAKVPVWGTADSGEKVTVRFGGQMVTTRAAADGKWMAALTPMAASATARTLTVTGKNVLRFEDVLVGEVWVCSGQSNMVLQPAWTENGAQEIKAANFPRIRMITVPAVTAQTPQKNFDGKLTPEDYDGQWAECSPDVMKNFSAVGYFFGRDLHQRLDTPIGLVGAYWSGTPAQAWTSQDVLGSDPQLKSYLSRWAEHTTNYPRLKAEYDVRAAAAKARRETLSVWLDPVPQDPVISPSRPANLFNGMIAPLIPFAIRGAIWYQGEGNAGNAEDAMLYHHLFSVMITDWRKRWGEGDFPFLFVQLCAINKRQQEAVEMSSNWAILRESQLKTLALPNTAMAVIFDTDPTGYLHPTNKKPVGERLALSALKVAYGKDVEESGPVFNAMEIQGDKILLRFKHVGGGLVSKSNNGLKSFAVAGKDRKFVWADAKIIGDTVVVSSPQVKAPMAARYAWANNSEASLFNKARLPASPFRTDAWELPTAKSIGGM
ncbi:MAG TPA: sialate O-acetylesterase [Gemmataceae bacterium]|nr:sialate O-acetylesterase [Gemmataceae bacterium]